MNTITLIAFFIMIFGIFFLLNISPVQFMEDMFNYFEKKDENIEKRIKLANENKKDRYIIALVKETKVILEHTNKTDKFSKICFVAIISSVLGIFIAVGMGNYFLIPVLGIGFLTIPFYYIKFTAMEYKKAISKELEASLSVITSSYMRTENIIKSVEENINQIKPPIRNFFDEFLVETEYVSTDTSSALLNLRNKIDDDIFHEWIDLMIMCQDNRTIKNTLNPTVSKLSNIRVLSAEINNNMYDPIKEFITMLILVYINIPLLYLLNRDWYKTLMETIPGKIVLAIVVIVTFVSFAGIMKLTKPIEPSMLEEGDK